MNLVLPVRRRENQAPVVFVLCVFVAMISLGCGRAKYERRLQKTIALANYREKLDKNLTINSWKQNGVEIRVPKQFSRMEGPVQPKTEEGEEPSEEAVPDPRQPEFLSVPLPGLLGAWKADVALVDAEGTVPAYLYVLTNYEMWRTSGQGERASTFNQNIAPVAVVDGLRAKLPEQAEWTSEKHPRDSPDPDVTVFVPQNNLTAATVKSTVRLPMTTEGESGEPSSRLVDVPVNCKMYLAENKDIHVLVLLIIPEQIDAREKLSLDTTSKGDSRIAMSLETLKVPSKKPKAGSGKDGKSSGGGRGGF